MSHLDKLKLHLCLTNKEREEKLKSNQDNGEYQVDINTQTFLEMPTVLTQLKRTLVADS